MGCPIAKYDFTELSNHGLLSESEKEIEAAHKAPAKPAIYPEELKDQKKNTQPKIQRDDFQLTDIALKVADQSTRLSVLNVTEAMKIVSINQPVHHTNFAIKITLHLDMPGAEVAEQKCRLIAGKTYLSNSDQAQV